jgi:peptidoglycan/LPS O-acetylase OafA/YrhL
LTSRPGALGISIPNPSDQGAVPAQEQLDCIQVLRAVAALAVVATHASAFRESAWGVDLFFVISGFIMCFTTERSGRNFLAKRVVRIVPLYWAGTLAIFCVALAAPHLLRSTHADIAELLKSLAFVPYRKGSVIQPLLYVGWTINLEIFFYLLFAAAMAITHRHRALLCSLIMAALVVAGATLHYESVAFEFFSDPIMLEFSFGMFCHSLYRWTGDIRSRPRPVVSRAAWALLGTLLIACLPLTGVFDPGLPRVLKWGLIAALAFFCVVHGLSGMKLPALPVAVGDASYSLYLFHLFPILLFSRVFGSSELVGPLAILAQVAAIALCCWLAVLCYRYVEKPLTGFLRRCAGI